MTIDLDQLLFPLPETPPSWEEVVDFFQNGDFPDEPYCIEAIEKYLQTEEQRAAIFEQRLSIEKMLNGRYEGDKEAFVYSIYAQWNAKLGFQYFGN